MCILVVEDNVILRLTLIDFLEDIGLDVVDAENATAALGIVDRPPEKITVLVTDLNLGPGENGLVLAAKARLYMPHLCVVYATGSPEMLEGRIMRSWERAFFKPFDTSRLASEVLALDQAIRMPVRL